MPESEPKPKLIELVAPGAGQGWKAVLKDGKAAVVHEIPVPPAEATAAVPRMQRLYDHRHPALSPVLAWGIDTNGLWVAVQPNEGTPLGSILTRGPLTPPAAAALGAAVLSGVAALHEAGIAMGGFGAQAVRVTTNGDVRLAGHPAAAVRGAPSQSDLRADVRSCGMAVCAAFGVDPAGAPAPANIPPGLVVTMRSMASGAMGPSADRAQSALREMAAALLAPDRQMTAQSELATRAGGREVPAITPFLPGGAVAAPSQPVQAAAASAPPAPPPAPPFIAPPQRDQTPIRQSVSYEAPDRPLQTYPSMPAVTFPSAPLAPPGPVAPPAPAAPPPPAPEEAIPDASEKAMVEPAIPTWGSPDTTSTPPAASAVAPPEAPVEPPPPEPAPGPTWSTSPPAPPGEPEPAVPSWSSSPPAEAAEPAPAVPTWSSSPSAPPAEPAPAVPTWSSSPSAPPAEPAVPTWSTNPPAPAKDEPAAVPSWSTNPPAPAAPVEPAPAPASPPPVRSPSQPTWTPMEQPVWKPGNVVPAEPLGTGEAIPALDLPIAEAPREPKREPAAEPDFLTGTRSDAAGLATVSAPTPAPPAPPARPTPPPSAPARKPSDRRPKSGGGAPSERPAWLIPAAIAIAIVLLLGTLGVIVLANRGNPTGGVTHPSPSTRPTASPKGSPSASPTGGLQTVPTYAPSSAAPVKSVQICTPSAPCNIPGGSPEKATVCTLGGSCRVEVAVFFTTAQKSVVVSYTLKFFDRCTGVTTDLPGTQTTTSSSGWIVAIPTDHLAVRLPAGAKSGALVAVSSKPGVAASAPLLLGADSC